MPVGARLPFHLCDHVPGKAADDDPDAGTPAHPCGQQDGVPVFWLWQSPDLNAVAMGAERVSQEKISISLPSSSFQINLHTHTHFILTTTLTKY